jgi:hypothetical protein
MLGTHHIKPKSSGSAKTVPGAGERVFLLYASCQCNFTDLFSEQCPLKIDVSANRTHWYAHCDIRARRPTYQDKLKFNFAKGQQTYAHTEYIK